MVCTYDRINESSFDVEYKSPLDRILHEILTERNNEQE